MSSWNSFCYVWFPQKGPSNECPCVNNQPLAKNYDLKISKVLDCMFFDGLCSYVSHYHLIHLNVRKNISSVEFSWWWNKLNVNFFSHLDQRKKFISRRKFGMNCLYGLNLSPYCGLLKCQEWAQYMGAKKICSCNCRI